MNSHPLPASSSNLRSPSPETAPPRIALIGYGEGAGREHARRLRDRGHDVRVGMLPGGMSWVHAVEDGLRPTRVRAAVADADLIVLLVPPTEQELLYWEEVAPATSKGALVIFTDAIELDAERLPKGTDAAVIAMSAGGCTVSVRADATGRAHERALAYLQALGGNIPQPASSSARMVDDNDPFPHPSMRVL